MKAADPVSSTGDGHDSELCFIAAASSFVGGEVKVAGFSRKTPATQGENRLLFDKTSPHFRSADWSARRTAFSGQEVSFYPLSQFLKYAAYSLLRMEVSVSTLCRTFALYRVGCRGKVM